MSLITMFRGRKSAPIPAGETAFGSRTYIADLKLPQAAPRKTANPPSGDRLAQQLQLVTEIEQELPAACPEYASVMKMLRQLVSARLSSEKRSVLGVVSARPAEGRTTVALSLAAALAEIYDSVVFVEASRGAGESLEEQFGSLPTLKVEAFFRDETTLTPAIAPSSKKGLSLVLAGGVAANIGPLKMVAGMRALLSELRGRFDMVVVDLPPVLVSEEAAALACELDSVVLVVEAGRTGMHDVEKAMKILQPATVKGVVLNKVSYETPAWLASLLTTDAQRGVL